MIYALLGSNLAWGIALALLLWRKAVAEKTTVKERAAKNEALDKAARALEELSLQSSAFADQLGRQVEQINTLRTQRDEAIIKLEKSGAPGSITDLLRLRLKVPGA